MSDPKQPGATGIARDPTAWALHSVLFPDLQHQVRGQIFLWKLTARCATLIPRCISPAFAL